MAKRSFKINPEKEKPELDGSDFEIGGKKYRFRISKFIIPEINDGKAITALEAKASPEALAYLVNNKSSVIEEIA